jgi:hypothetical protein
MGMFDYVRIKWPLPWPEVQDSVWQSKDTPAQYLDNYEVREDGTLWHEAYDLRHEYTDDAPLGYWQHRDNIRREQVRLDGEIECHEFIEDPRVPGRDWYSVQFWFRDGVVKDAAYTKSRSGVAADGSGSPTDRQEKTTRRTT